MKVRNVITNEEYEVHWTREIDGKPVDLRVLVRHDGRRLDATTHVMVREGGRGAAEK